MDRRRRWPAGVVAVAVAVVLCALQWSRSGSVSGSGSAGLVGAPRDVSLSHVRTPSTVTPEDERLCGGWCLGENRELVDCSASGLERLSRAFKIENCVAATQSAKSLELVTTKIEKLADNTVFVFFRGAAALFDYNMMCADPSFAEKKLNMPRVYSNGDCHPENFGVMTMANGQLVWGPNDFDQSFLTPFTWDLKRGATGFAIASGVRGWADEDASTAALAFVESYVATVVDHGCVFRNTDRYVEGGQFIADHAPWIQGLFDKSRAREAPKATKKWQAKMSIDVDNDCFVESDAVQPLPTSMLPDFQASVEAYLYHGVAALAKAEFVRKGGFWDVVSVARKLGSGTGSIGLSRFYLLLKGRYADEADQKLAGKDKKDTTKGKEKEKEKSQGKGYIVLEMKEEVNSVLEAFFGYRYTASQEGKRAVDAVRSSWPYSNLFYGWTTYKGRAFIIREKSKHHVSTDVDSIGKDAFMDFAGHAGRALALYHVRARCNDAACALQETSALDEEICDNILGYLQQQGVRNFTQYVHGFALDEAKRQTTAWNLLREFVNPRKDTHTSFELLYGPPKPTPC